MIIIKMSILYFIQIRHTDDFPSTGTRLDLTRFNKIAIQGTPQMAVDKEALICLSRVYSYYFK